MKPQVFPGRKNKNLPHIGCVSEILSADPDAQLSISTCFGGPTLSQHIKGGHYRHLDGLP